jgi:integrase/recombinase XerD
MAKNYFISIVLDKRRSKADGKFPVKLRVFTPSPRTQKLYATKFEYTEKEFQSIWETTKPRTEHKEQRFMLQALESKANDTANGLNPFTFQEFEKKLFRKAGESQNILYQYSVTIERLIENEQLGTAKNYEQTVKSLIEFYTHQKGREPKKILFAEITPEWLQKYERFMTEKGRSLTTVSMYLRTLRTVFNQTISEGEIPIDLYPFGKKKYQMPAVQNVKKALNHDHLKLLFNATPMTPEQERAKDFWFFSYTCNGMNIKDIALLKYKDLQGDKIVFYRAKTKTTSKANLKPVTVYLNDYSLSIIEKYGNKDKSIQNLIFGIISEENSPEQNFRAIKNFTISINKSLKKLALSNGLTQDISTYWARHSFATNAIRNGASMEFVSEALSHSDLKTTQGYFAGFEDSAKREIMNNLMKF